MKADTIVTLALVAAGGWLVVKKGPGLLATLNAIQANAQPNTNGFQPSTSSTIPLFPPGTGPNTTLLQSCPAGSYVDIKANKVLTVDQVRAAVAGVPGYSLPGMTMDQIASAYTASFGPLLPC